MSSSCGHSHSIATPSVRLPTNVIPHRYNITLVPDLDACTFQGYVEISLRVITSTNVIECHSADLTYSQPDKIKVTRTDISGESKEQKSFACRTLSFDLSSERVIFGFENLLAAGEYILHASYTGILNDKLAGFYRSKYTTPDGVTHNMACTQFESCDARRALPCWDEPAIKAIFEVTLIVARGLSAVSNMPIVSQHTTSATTGNESHGLVYKAGLVQYRYGASPIMSTYLLAFVIAHFDYIMAKTKSGVEVRVYLPLGKSSFGKFSLDVAVRSLEFFDEYFGLPYPLPKVDLLAIPDFAAGAMENWGCITYRDNRLLVDPANTSVATMQAIAKTVSHELAHMWFGNLVTMEWWTYLWLNEGFASFMEDACVAHLFPEWDIWTSFVSAPYASALSLDSLESSHPIEVEVKHPHEINEIFDTISYAKGASVIRMLHDYLGADIFMKGVRAYLRQFAYKNTHSDDLWNSLAAASGKPVYEIMKSWLQHTGYPVVIVEDMKIGTSGDVVLRVRQERFMLSGAKPSVTPPIWTIPLPISYVMPDGRQSAVQYLVLDRVADELKFSVAPGTTAVLLNRSFSSFFRTQYTPSALSSIAKSLSSLSPVDRLGLLGDVCAMAKCGRSTVGDLMDFASLYSSESTFYVIEVLSSELKALASVHDAQPYFAAFQKFVHRLYSPLYAQLGWSARAGEDQVTSLFRANVLSMMALADDAAFQAEAIRRFDLFQADEKANNIAADLRSAVYGVIAKQARGYDTLLAMYRRSQMQEEKQRLLSAIGRVSGTESRRRVLEWGISSKEVRKGDIIYIFSSFASTSVEGRTLAWDYMRANWSYLMSEFASSGFILGGFVSGVVNPFTDVTRADEIEAFANSHETGPCARAFKQAIEAIRAKSARLARQKEPLAAWFAAHTTTA